MKQETFDQLMRIAGFGEKCCVALMDDQVKAMLEGAYEAGQRDLSFMTKPETQYEPYDIMIQDEAGNLRPISTGE